MRLVIYDKNPGPGVGQWFLKLSWFLGCFYQKLIGQVDAYYGAKTWDEAVAWLATYKSIYSLQYWGHGSPGMIWMGQQPIQISKLSQVKDRFTPASVFWMRACSTFQGQAGYRYSEGITEILNCVVAGHTRIIGLLQGGLHTRAPLSPPSWPVTEGEFKKSWWPSYLKWGNNTVTCFATKVPKGW